MTDSVLYSNKNNLLILLPWEKHIEEASLTYKLSRWDLSYTHRFPFKNKKMVKQSIITRLGKQNVLGLYI